MGISVPDTVVINRAFIFETWRNFTYGSYCSIVYNLTICTFPVLVLLTGRAVLYSLRDNLRIMDENTILRVEGKLLFENYRMLDH